MSRYTVGTDWDEYKVATMPSRTGLPAVILHWETTSLTENSSNRTFADGVHRIRCSWKAHDVPASASPRTKSFKGDHGFAGAENYWRNESNRLLQLDVTWPDPETVPKNKLRGRGIPTVTGTPLLIVTIQQEKGQWVVDAEDADLISRFSQQDRRLGSWASFDAQKLAAGDTLNEQGRSFMIQEITSATRRLSTCEPLSYFERSCLPKPLGLARKTATPISKAHTIEQPAEVAMPTEVVKPSPEVAQSPAVDEQPKTISVKRGKSVKEAWVLF